MTGKYSVKTNTGLLAKIRARTVNVKTEFGELDLFPPRREDADKVRSAWKNLVKYSTGKDEDLFKGVEAIRDYMVTAVWCCMGGSESGLELDDCAEILDATGGERGDVALAAGQLCGLETDTINRLRKGEADDPT